MYTKSSAPIPPNSGELLSYQETVRLFKHLKQNSDYLIIDTAAIDLITDASLSEKFVDSGVFIVRHKYLFKAVFSFID
jgi:tyrosine-protein kinase Etk/Wzc